MYVHVYVWACLIYMHHMSAGVQEDWKGTLDPLELEL